MADTMTGTQTRESNQGREGMQGRSGAQSQQRDEPRKHSEGPVARMIENQTAKLPSDVFLWAAFGSIGGSLFLQMMGKKDQSLFVGQWAPTFLLLGLYNKIVKVAGSDRVQE